MRITYIPRIPIRIISNKWSSFLILPSFGFFVSFLFLLFIYLFYCLHCIYYYIIIVGRLLVYPLLSKNTSLFWLVVLKYNSDWNFIIHLHFVFIIVFVFFAFAFCFLLRLLFFCSLWSGQGKARQGCIFR
jgi:hypothetical protein